MVVHVIGLSRQAASPASNIGENMGDAQVLVLGAGPAGLVVGNMLRAAGVSCQILERRPREYVESRARAGFLAQGSVRILQDNGLADGLLRAGWPHDVCAFRAEHGEFLLRYGELGRGETHTVYPQQNLVRDLMAEFLARGGEIRFGCTVTDVDPVRGAVRCTDEGGSTFELEGTFIAGCDGSSGSARQAVPRHGRCSRDYGIGWLAVLAEAPQSMAAVTYAVHERGFAGHMARGPAVTRYYLQCSSDDDPANWDDARIWGELRERMRTSEHGSLQEGRVIERRVVRLRSDVAGSLQHGALFLAGDAASLISPSAAKGANLAIFEAHVLANALTAALVAGDEKPLEQYSATCLPTIWRAQEFSNWMINLLHVPAGSDDEAVFQRSLQLARLAGLRDSRMHQDHFAENYVGI